MYVLCAPNALDVVILACLHFLLLCYLAESVDDIVVGFDMSLWWHLLPQTQQYTKGIYTKGTCSFH